MDLQNKLLQYALNSEGSNMNMEDVEMMDVDYNSDLENSRNPYAESVSEPITPQTPSVIPLEHQNKVKRSLVKDSPTNVKTTFLYKIRGIEAESVTHDSKTPIKPISESVPEPCLSLILYNKPIFSNLDKKQEGLYLSFLFIFIV